MRMKKEVLLSSMTTRDLTTKNSKLKLRAREFKAKLRCS